jgi:hypothetical protein
MWSKLIAVMALVMCLAGTGAAQAVMVPKVIGPVPVIADSYPFLAANKNQQPMDLSARGYIEEEFIVTGMANVYDWVAGALTVKTPAAPYTTRILLRRPATAARFSGSVIVELMNPARRWDWPMMWGYTRDYIMEHGDAWVGVTMPLSVAGLQKFDPTRYASLSFADEGQRWDMLSQVGALLKSSLAVRPLLGFRVEHLYMTTQGGDLTTYMAAIHSQAKLADGKPVYDGYVAKALFNLARINPSAPAPPANDPRQIVKNVGVPVIAVTAQGEVVGGTFASRRPDSDETADRYRLYEVASAGHIDKSAYLGFPSMQDQAAAGNAQGSPQWPFTAKCDPDIPLMEPSLMALVFNAAFASLDEWVRKGTPAPRAARIEIKDGAVVTDELGHGIGGVRTPYIEVPDATYFTNTGGPGNCREMGRKVPFDGAKFNAVHGDRKNFSSKFNQAVDRLLKERWLTEGDAKRLKEGN